MKEYKGYRREVNRDTLSKKTMFLWLETTERVLEGLISIGMWRTDRDSNPGDGLPPTHFPGVRLRPLGHLSTETLFYRLLLIMQDY